MLRDPILYEINTRSWLRELSSKAGADVSLADVPDREVQSWITLGFTHIWLMGVWSSGPQAQATAVTHMIAQPAQERVPGSWKEEDISGSPYAIAEYAVPAALGGGDGLKRFRDRLNSRGLKLVLDFVPNHVGIDHPWVHEQPALFVQSAAPTPGFFPLQTGSQTRWLAHGKDPYFPPWSDTAQLDYRRAATRKTMIATLESIAARCDGVRCDMAMLLLNDVFDRTWRGFPAQAQPPEGEFWPEAIAAVRKAYPQFLFLAECYWGLEPRLQDQGFDFTYDKTLYDLIVARNAPGVQKHLLEQAPSRRAKSAHFLENHDEPRIAALLSPDEHRCAALLFLGLPGMRLIHEGQLAGARIKTPVQMTARPPEPEQPAIRSMYDQLLLALQSTAVGRGEARLLQPQPASGGSPSPSNLVLIEWRDKPTALDLVAVNLAAQPSQCFAPLSADALPSGRCSIKDLIGTEVCQRSGTDLAQAGFLLELAPHGAKLLSFRNQS